MVQGEAHNWQKGQQQIFTLESVLMSFTNEKGWVGARSEVYGNKQWRVKWILCSLFSVSIHVHHPLVELSCRRAAPPYNTTAPLQPWSCSTHPARIKTFEINHFNANNSDQLVIQNTSSCNRSQTARFCQVLKSKAAWGQIQKENKPHSLKVSTKETALQITACLH